jgi:hypothetical protein
MQCINFSQHLRRRFQIPRWSSTVVFQLVLETFASPSPLRCIHAAMFEKQQCVVCDIGNLNKFIRDINSCESMMVV